MYRGPSTREYGGQAADDDIRNVTSPENDVGARKNVRSRKSSGNGAAAVGSERSAMQMAKQREEEEQYRHDAAMGTRSERSAFFETYIHQARRQSQRSDDCGKYHGT